MELICNSENIVTQLVLLLQISHTIINKSAALILVNLSACEKGAQILSNNENCVRVLMENILKPDSNIADACCMILSNISRPLPYVELVIKSVTQSKFEELLNVFTKVKYNNKGQNLYYLGPVLSNLSQSSTIRKWLLDEDKCYIEKLLPFTEYRDSIVKRGGVIGTLRNCCFETDWHERLLTSKVDILPQLLLPLAGNTEYTDEENEKLPPELQYLLDDKQREEDPDIRCMLLEALTQLCTLQKNREYVRNKNTYVILRELHKWETDPKVLLTCEHLVNILIRFVKSILSVSLN